MRITVIKSDGTGEESAKPCADSSMVGEEAASESESRLRGVDWHFDAHFLAICHSRS